MEKRQIKLENRIINYELDRKKVKNINLRIRKDGSIYVSANKSVPYEFIDNFIVSKEKVILKHIDIIKKSTNEEIKKKNYETGEKFWILGKEHSLKVIESMDESVKYEDNCLFLYTKDIDNINRKRYLINCFFDELARKTFKELLDNIYIVFLEYGVAYPELKIRKMTSRWGTCYYLKEKIIINKRLIELDRDCVEYVILHEMVHFLHPNHSKSFYNTVEKLMPDWKERKKLLKKESEKIY